MLSISFFDIEVLMKTLSILVLFLYATCAYSYLRRPIPRPLPNPIWRQSSTVCHAQTICPNGVPISCVAYGMNYSNVPSRMANMCRSRVVPGYMVHCQGYTQQIGPWGRRIWAAADMPIRCY
jgi:hypothetical protein